MACCYRCSMISLCVPVCMCAGHDCELCKNGWTDWDAIWVVKLRGPKEPYIRWVPRSPRERGIWGERCGLMLALLLRLVTIIINSVHAYNWCCCNEGCKIHLICNAANIAIFVSHSSTTLLAPSPVHKLLKPVSLSLSPTRFWLLLNTSTPSYLAEILSLYIPIHTFQSFFSLVCMVLTLICLGFHSVHIAAPTVWNSVIRSS